MSGWGRLIRSTAAACAVGLVTAVAVSPAAGAVASPLPRLILPGLEYEVAERFPAIASLPLVTRYITPNRQIGEGFFPGSVPVLVDYPASLFAPGTANAHIDIGVTRLEAEIAQRQGPLAVVGHSQGAEVLDRVRTRLQGDPAAPAADQLQFVLFNSPTRGLATTLFQEGVRVPIVDVTVTPPAESRYDTSVVINEYDIWGDFPDRPWNPVTLLNAVAALVFVHSLTDTAPSEFPPEDVTAVVNSLGATDTTYFFPARRLPLTEVLRIVGVADEIVDVLDEALRPMIDAGYSRNDQPGDPRPYLDHGVLTTHQQSARTAAASAAPAPEPAGGIEHSRVAAVPAEAPAPGVASPERAILEPVRRATTRPQSTATRNDRAAPGPAATVGAASDSSSESRSTARAPHRDRHR